jgi:hypothetical protein
MNEELLDELEFELRSLSGVMNVGLTASAGGEKAITVVARRQDLDVVRTEAQLIANLYAPGLTIEVRSAAEPSSALASATDVVVGLVKAEFDPSDGSAEVTLVYDGALATGRSNSGPLIGAAEATLVALRHLGLDLPVYLAGVSLVDAIPGSPVVVTVRSLGSHEQHTGVAQAAEEALAAVAATLDALSRAVRLRHEVTDAECDP